MTQPIIFWFRQDLRLHDNPALFNAVQERTPLILLFIDDGTLHSWSIGAASRWWLHQSLVSLENSLNESYGASLTLQKGDPLQILLNLINKTDAKAVFWNRCYEPETIKRDKIIKSTLEKRQIRVESFNGSLLHDPWEYQNASKQPFKVFTPFWKKLKTLLVREVYPKPPKFSSLHELSNITLKELFPAPNIRWDKKIAHYWLPGEKSAKDKLNHFFKFGVENYKIERNNPSKEKTSKLSPHLHFGEISPIQIWHAALNKKNNFPQLSEDIDHFLSELAWREFSYHLLYYFPSLPNEAFKAKFKDFSWKKNAKLLKEWQKGLTGYPIVDAGMRELWETGWMHNRVRMIVASFLVKDLLQPWQNGEAWFWNTLVDADLANNAASWQWVAGSGVDAAPYFRIFNPTLQGQKFDPDGEYIKRWVPELKNLPAKYIHTPGDASTEILQKANVILGKTYPHPIVNHTKARNTALELYKKLK